MISYPQWFVARVGGVFVIAYFIFGIFEAPTWYWKLFVLVTSALLVVVIVKPRSTDGQGGSGLRRRVGA